MSPKLTGYFADYEDYHRTSGNKFCHYFGIPFIVISLLGLLSLINLGPDSLAGSALLRIDGGAILWLLASLWYVLLDWKIGLSFSFVTLGMYFIGRSIPVPALVGLQVVGWILQGVGHAVYEKRSPAFVSNLTHIFIGPIWIFAHFMGFSR